MSFLRRLPVHGTPSEQELSNWIGRFGRQVVVSLFLNFVQNEVPEVGWRSVLTERVLRCVQDSQDSSGTGDVS